MISPGRGRIGKKTPLKKTKPIGHNGNFNISQANLFAVQDQLNPDISVGDKTENVIGQPTRDGREKRDSNQGFTKSV